MTTTITPAAGAGALFTQGGIGATPGYSALDDRRADSQGLQEGVIGASDFMVVQRAAGANMSVDIGMPAGGFALVQGDTISGQGLYTVPVHSTTINEVIAAANATNPRIDSVILEVQDTTLDGSGGNQARTRVLTGTASAGATLSNRLGAVLLPGNALLLADVLVGAAVGSIGNTVIRDRRPWARGAYARIIRNSANYTTTSTTLATVDATNLSPRVECSGVPVRIRVSGIVAHSVSNAGASLALAIDGTPVDGGDKFHMQYQTAVTAGNGVRVDAFWDTVPTAGSHTFALQFATNTAGTMTLAASAASPLVFTAEEIVRQNTQNNATTSG